MSRENEADITSIHKMMTRKRASFANVFETSKRSRTFDIHPNLISTELAIHSNIEIDNVDAYKDDSQQSVQQLQVQGRSQSEENIAALSTLTLAPFSTMNLTQSLSSTITSPIPISTQESTSSIHCMDPNQSLLSGSSQMRSNDSTQSRSGTITSSIPISTQESTSSIHCMDSNKSSLPGSQIRSIDSTQLNDNTITTSAVSRVQQNLTMRVTDLISKRRSFLSQSVGDISKINENTEMVVNQRSMSMENLSQLTEVRIETDEATDNNNDGNNEKEEELRDIKWLCERKFNNENELNDFLKQENTWAKAVKDNKRLNGIKQYYRCNYVIQRAKKQCDAAIFTIADYKPGCSEIELYRKNKDHNHSQLTELSKKAKSGKIDEVREKIGDMYGNRLKPTSIRHQLRKMPGLTDEDQPSNRQIKYAIELRKQKTYGTGPLTLKTLTDFFSKHNDLPVNQDEAFIVMFQRSPPGQIENQWFRYFVSTRQLLENCAQAKTLHADGTYKLIFQRYPVIVVGASDLARNFHLIGIAVSLTETADDYEFIFNSVMHGVNRVTGEEFRPKTLVADAAPAIRNGFERAFHDEDCQVIMCWFHVMMNIKKQKLQDVNNREAIVDDIRQIHLSYSQKVFEKGCELFCLKWKPKEPTFVQYLIDNWLVKNSNWFIGAAVRVPRTNNHTENLNGRLKKYHTYYEVKPMQEFKNDLMGIVTDYSKEYVRDKAPFKAEIELSDDKKMAGHKYWLLKMPIVNKGLTEKNEVEIYFRAKENKDEIQTDELDQFIKADWKTFDEFADKAFGFHRVLFNNDAAKWQNSICTCPSFGKDFMCKHIVALAFRLELILPPFDDPDDIPLAPKKKPGRPKKAKKGLTKD